MKSKWLAIGISTVSVIILILTSLTNVVGYQTVQTSQENVIKERITQRELLFQTIVDIVNNKEIQRVILKSQMSRGIFPTSEFPIVTKNQIKMMYFLGLILSKVISKSRMQSIVEKHQFSNHGIQKEISVIIEKDVTLRSEITQLQNSECDCENENIVERNFPIICNILNNTALAFSNTLAFLGVTLYGWVTEHNKSLFAKIIDLSYDLLCYLGIPLVFLLYTFNCWEVYNPL